MDDATKHYRNQFFQEAREILDQVNDDLLRAEADPENQEILNSIFRGVHTIKGSAGSFDLDDISEFAHHLENILNRLRDGQLLLSPELVDAILVGLDQLHSLLEAAASGGEARASEKVVADLQAFLEEGAASAREEKVGENGGMVEHDEKETDSPGETEGRGESIQKEESPRVNSFLVEINFTGQHLAHGYDPLVLLKNIKDGAESYRAESAGVEVPPIHLFEPLDLYLNPKASIRTTLSREDVVDLAFDPELITVSSQETALTGAGSQDRAGRILERDLPVELRNDLEELVDRGLFAFRLNTNFTNEHLEHGYDPLVLLRNIRNLSQIYQVVDIGAVPPPLQDFEPLNLYLKPELIVATDSRAERIEDLTFDPDLLTVSPLGGSSLERPLAAAGLNIDPEDMEEFLVGSFELLDSLEKSAMTYEAQGDSTSLNEIFRTIHTIKGDSDYLGLKELAVFTHALESMLERLRSRSVKRSPDTIDILLQSADYLRQSLNALRKGRLVIDLPTVFDKISPYLDEEAAALKTSADPPGYDQDMGRAFVEQARQKADLLRSVLKKEVWEEKDRKNVQRMLSGLANAAGVVGIQFIAKPVEAALAALRQGEEDTVRHLVEDLAAYVRGLEEEPKRIGEILVEEGKITEEDLQNSLAQQKPLGAILVAGGKVKKEDVDRALSKQNLMEAARQAKPAETAEPEVRTMRVDERKIDQFGNYVGELLIVRNTYEYLFKQLGDLEGANREILKTIRENQHLLTRLTNDIHHGVMALRMIPIRGIFQRFQRVVRDISRKQKKNIQYLTEGDEIEIDKKAADALADPLIHLVRNACDHGIETPAERKEAGKSEKAIVKLRASQEGSNLSIRIMDDGKGIDRTRLFEKAARLGYEVSGPDDPGLLDFIFMPGLSTREDVSEVSGRGVGMDVVKTSIQSLGGSVQVNSEEGRGTQVVLSIPMTMGVSTVLMVESDGSSYAMPLDAVSETLKIKPEKIRRAGRQTVFHYRGRVIALAGLAELLDGRGNGDGFQPGAGEELVPVVIVESMQGQFGLIVDDLIGNMELAIKPLPPKLADIKLYSGVSLLGDGKVLFILNPDFLSSGQ